MDLPQIEKANFCKINKIKPNKNYLGLRCIKFNHFVQLQTPMESQRKWSHALINKSCNKRPTDALIWNILRNICPVSKDRMSFTRRLGQINTILWKRPQDSKATILILDFVYILIPLIQKLFLSHYSEGNVWWCCRSNNTRSILYRLSRQEATQCPRHLFLTYTISPTPDWPTHTNTRTHHNLWAYKSITNQNYKLVFSSMFWLDFLPADSLRLPVAAW